MLGDAVRWRTRPLAEIREGDRFAFERNEQAACWVAAAERDGDTIAVYTNREHTTTVALVIPPGEEYCLLEPVVVTITRTFTLVIDVRAWSRTYPSVAPTPVAVRADAEVYFARPHIPTHLWGTVREGEHPDAPA